MNTCILTIGLLFGWLTPAQAGGPPLPANADPAWAVGWQEEIEQQFKMLTAAYGLDESAQALLRQELQRRMNDQYVYDQALEANLADLAARMEAAKPAPGSPADQAFSAELDELINHMPLAPDELALWTEGQVPEKVAAEGRARYQEIRNRKDQQRSTMQVDDPVRMGGMKKGFIDARQADTAPVTPSAKPMPRGPKGESEKAEIEAKANSGKVVQPNQGLAGATPAAAAAGAAPPPKPGEAVKLAEMKPQPAKPGEAVKPAEMKPQPAKTPGESKVDPRPQAQPPPVAAAPQPPRPQPQPQAAVAQPQPPPKVAPLDEWDNYVILVSGKYRFTDAQVTKAQAILRDLRRRAYQYQVSRAADFSRVELITDAKVKQARLGELNRPLAAMFEELKQRLESLPTSQQRQQAEAGVKKPVGKK